MKTFTLVAAATFTTDVGQIDHGTVLGELRLVDSLPLANLTSLLRTGRCNAIDQDDATPPAGPEPVDEPEPSDSAPELSVDQVSSPATPLAGPEPDEDTQPAPASAPAKIGDEDTLTEAGIAKKFADLFESELGITTVGQLRAHVADGGSLEDPDGVGPVTAKMIAALIGM